MSTDIYILETFEQVKDGDIEVKPIASYSLEEDALMGMQKEFLNLLTKYNEFESYIHGKNMYRKSDATSIEYYNSKKDIFLMVKITEIKLD